MNDEAIRQAAQALWQAFDTAEVIDDLPATCRPTTRGDGYAVQNAMVALSGESTGCWKIAATAVAGQKHIGVDGPLAGRILRSHVHESGATLSLAGNRMRVAEVEFAFRFASKLAPRAAPYTDAEVLAAVDALIPAIEVPDSRFSRFERAGAAQLIADNACAWRFVQGKPTAFDWRSLDLAAHTVDVRLDSGETLTGHGAAVLGDPRTALAWFVNELNRHSIGISAGEIVTTGTCVVPIPIQPGMRIDADFGSLGAVSALFA